MHTPTRMPTCMPTHMSPHRPKNGPPQWAKPYSVWGKRYGGIASEAGCSALPSALQEGCRFRFKDFKSADNPHANMRRVSCPKVLTEKSQCARSDDNTAAPGAGGEAPPAETPETPGTPDTPGGGGGGGGCCSWNGCGECGKTTDYCNANAKQCEKDCRYPQLVDILEKKRVVDMSNVQWQVLPWQEPRCDAAFAASAATTISASSLATGWRRRRRRRWCSCARRRRAAIAVPGRRG